jgi:antitoxin (DNA-binding transcriptional repressor) of toxin-antitoxin stability system
LTVVIFLVQDVVMIRINIHEAKANLSRYLARDAAGETILVCNRNVPVAEIRLVPARRKTRRPIGLARGTFTVPPAFFEPLPAEDLDAWLGKTS